MLKLLTPHVSSLGYALFVVINATQVWGGVFPFLPTGFQAPSVILAFYLSQSLAFFLSFVCSTIGSWHFPGEARRMLVTLGCSLLFLGSVSIIAIMYVPRLTLPLTLCGGVLLGVGSAAVFMLWQRYFSSIDAQACNYRLILGTALGAALYFCLHLIPIALTAFLIPVVLVPLSGLCLSLSIREMDFEQPMFQDEPKSQPTVYRHLIKSIWRSALCVGSLGFASGLARGVGAQADGLIDSLNEISMIGMLIAAGLLFLIWMFTSARFSMGHVFRIIYPILMTALILFPFMTEGAVGLFAGMTYMIFTFVTLIMMMQCAQISRDRGTNPVFTYGIYGCVAYGIQSIGFILGWITGDIHFNGISQVAFLSLIATYVIGITLLVAVWPYLSNKPRTSRRIEAIEFSGRLAPEAILTDSHSGSPLTSPNVSEQPTATAPSSEEPGLGQPVTPTASSKPARKPKLRFDAGPEYQIQDRISKKCLALSSEYGLSIRETEVMELIAQGQTVSAIASALFISENTVRTHSKHVYSKLGIHSKQELSTLIESAPSPLS